MSYLFIRDHSNALYMPGDRLARIRGGARAQIQERRKRGCQLICIQKEGEFVIFYFLFSKCAQYSRH